MYYRHVCSCITEPIAEMTIPIPRFKCAPPRPAPPRPARPHAHSLPTRPSAHTRVCMHSTDKETGCGHICFCRYEAGVVDVLLLLVSIDNSELLSQTTVTVRLLDWRVGAKGQVCADMFGDMCLS